MEEGFLKIQADLIKGKDFSAILEHDEKQMELAYKILGNVITEKAISFIEEEGVLTAISNSIERFKRGY